MSVFAKAKVETIHRFRQKLQFRNNVGKNNSNTTFSPNFISLTQTVFLFAEHKTSSMKLTLHPPTPAASVSPAQICESSIVVGLNISLHSSLSTTSKRTC